MLARLNARRKRQQPDRCPICGEVITGAGVLRYGKRFCHPWHADFYRPPPPWWRRLRWPTSRDPGGGGAAGCCG